MFLRTRETGDLVEILDISALVDPCRDEMPGRSRIGGEQQIQAVFKKSALQFPSGGPKILQWDGRDTEGDEIANGVYLYVLRGSWPDNGGHDAKQAGKLVIMR